MWMMSKYNLLKAYDLVQLRETQKKKKKKKIDAIMIIRDNEEVVIDLKQVYNKEYNDF